MYLHLQIIMTDPQPLVPGIEGDTIMAQILKVFEPPGRARAGTVEEEAEVRIFMNIFIHTLLNTI